MNTEDQNDPAVPPPLLRSEAVPYQLMAQQQSGK